MTIKTGTLRQYEQKQNGLEQNILFPFTQYLGLLDFTMLMMWSLTAIMPVQANQNLCPLHI